MPRIAAHPAGSHSRRGHTLWEMLLVLALLGTIGVLVAPAAPALRRPTDDDHVVQAARELEDVYATARRMALDRGEATLVVLDPAGARAWLFASDHDDMRLVGARALDVAADVRLVAASPRETIRFAPDGTSTGGTVLVLGATGSRPVSVNPWSGVADAE